MTDVLVVNHGLHEVCGVHDIGRRLFEAIPDGIDKASTASRRGTRSTTQTGAQISSS
jgi:hypothetical protein